MIRVRSAERARPPDTSWLAAAASLGRVLDFVCVVAVVERSHGTLPITKIK